MSATTNQEKYEKIFDAALSLFRVSKETGEPMGLSLAQCMFSVANEWERNPDRFPQEILDAALMVAVEWEKATTVDGNFL